MPDQSKTKLRSSRVADEIMAGMRELERMMDSPSKPSDHR
jgi:hypothetical protein